MVPYHRVHRQFSARVLSQERVHGRPHTHNKLVALHDPAIGSLHTNHLTSRWTGCKPMEPAAHAVTSSNRLWRVTLIVCRCWRFCQLEARDIHAVVKLYPVSVAQAHTVSGTEQHVCAG